ncbi:MAG: hypothetical protein QF732_11940 [Nitrospinaceae bacterium]|nr:hypothetical protein [Nitrospinaceae bacterium]
MKFLIREAWNHGACWNHRGIHEFATQADADQWIRENVWEQDETCWYCDALTIEDAIAKRFLPRGFTTENEEVKVH